MYRAKLLALYFVMKNKEDISMFKEILHFNDRDWIVRLTRKAMIEIEDMQKRKQRELINKEDNIEVLSKIGEVYKIQEEIDKANKMKD